MGAGRAFSSHARPELEISMLKLLIPVDGSEASHRAVDAAVRFAAETTVEVVLVNVREGAATYHGDRSPLEYEQIHARERDRQARVLEAALTHAKQAGLAAVTTLGEAGSPDIDIPRLATEQSADMIVMATRGLGAVSALLMGSVAQQVVRHATVPVLLVK
jgi:nucleotide-binding universal stress UspA family protein